MCLAVDQAFVPLVLWVPQSKFLTGAAILVDDCRIIAINLEFDFRHVEAPWVLRYEHVRLRLQKATNSIQPYRISRSVCIAEGGKGLDGGEVLVEDVCLRAFHLLLFSLVGRVNGDLRRYEVMLDRGLDDCLNEAELLVRSHRRDTPNALAPVWSCLNVSVSSVDLTSANFRLPVAYKWAAPIGRYTSREWKYQSRRNTIFWLTKPWLAISR